MKNRSFFFLLTYLLLSCNSNTDDTTQVITTPSIEVLNIENIDSESATINGALTNLDNLNIEDYGFVYAKSAIPTIDDNKISFGSSNNSEEFTHTFSELESSTNYQTRAYIIYDSQVTYSENISFETLAPSPWESKAEYPDGGTLGTAYFKINNEAYVGAGISATYSNRFYKYTLNNDEWTEISPIPNARVYPISFVIGEYGYVGLGRLPSNATLNDLWRYDPKKNIWEEMASLPVEGNYYATSFVIDNIAYVIGGDRDSDYSVWTYNPSLNLWEIKTTYPGIASAGLTAFVINNLAFVGLGYEDGTGNDFWKYDSVKNNWTPLNDFPDISRVSQNSITYNGKGYIFCGFHFNISENDFTYYNDIWEYNPLTDAWTMMEEIYPGNGRNEMFVINLNNKILIGTGTDDPASNPSQRYSDVWQLQPSW